MAYNLSLINGSGIVPFLDTVNSELMFGWYGNLVLITLFTILIMAMQHYTNNFKKSIQFSSLMTAVFAILFNGIGLVDTFAVVVSWIFAAIVAGVAFFTRD